MKLTLHIHPDALCGCKQTCCVLKEARLSKKKKMHQEQSELLICWIRCLASVSLSLCAWVCIHEKYIWKLNVLRCDMLNFLTFINFFSHSFYHLIWIEGLLGIVVLLKIYLLNNKKKLDQLQFPFTCTLQIKSFTSKINY